MNWRIAAIVVLVTTALSGCALHRKRAADSPHPGSGDQVETADPVEAPRPERSPEPVGPPKPTLLVDEGLSRDLILARLLRGRELLESLANRALDEEQRRQVETGAGFLEEADRALEQDDIGRADVLSEKALALIEDVAESD